MADAAAALKLKGPRACSTCAKAKSRCIPGPNEDKCERCHRLDKPCGNQTPAPPRKRKEPRPTRVAELERRLEALTHRVESVGRESASRDAIEELAKSPDPFHQKATAAKGPSDEAWPHPFMHLFPQDRDLQTAFPKALTAAPSPAPAIDKPVRPIFPPTPDKSPAAETPSYPVATTDQVWPDANEAPAMLHTYRTVMAALFPFIVVPPFMTSEELRQHRPFLWKALMLASANLDGARQNAMGNQLLKDITEAAFVKPAKSLDLLQGLQLLISWFHFSLNSFQMTNLLFLARSICVSLGFTESQNSTKKIDHTPSCLEQMRAYAGTYYLVTQVFTTNKKPDALMNTSYLEACCRVLDTRMEYPTDELLVYLVKAVQLAQSISLTLAFRSSSMQATGLPLNLIVKSFEQQIAAFKASLPRHLQEHPSLLGHWRTTQILLYEIGIPEDTNLSVTDRLEILWSCVNAANAYMDNRHSVASPSDPNEEPRFICMSAFDFIYAFLTMLKLVTLIAPGWDLAVVRQKMNIDQVVDSQLVHMEAFAARRRRTRPGMDANPEAEAAVAAMNDPFERLTQKLRMLKDLLGSELCRYLADRAESHKLADSPVLTIMETTNEIVADLDNSMWSDLAMGGDNMEWSTLDPSSYPIWQL